MTTKFDHFKQALVALCVEHSVHLSPSCDDEEGMEVYDADGINLSDDVWLEDKTK